MNQKKLGVTVLILSLLIGFVLIDFISETQNSGEEDGCFQDEDCQKAAVALTSSHLGIGIIFSLFSLALYLIVFSKSEDFWLKKLEQQRQDLTEEEKWNIIKLMLDENELKVIEEIKKQPGITQFTLRLRTDLSKSKLSDILSRFEKKGLIERHVKGKTLAVFLKPSF